MGVDKVEISRETIKKDIAIHTKTAFTKYYFKLIN